MKLICNNVWGGRVHKPLFDFIGRHAPDTDIFYFQEVFHRGRLVPGHGTESRMELFSEIGELLPGFERFLAPDSSPEESLAMFVREEVVFGKADYIFVQGENSARTEGIPLQYVQLQSEDGKRYTVCNLHGWWTPDFKGDTPERLEQSRNVRAFMDGIAGPKIICGDFNLTPDTESLRILERDMKNLIREYGVASTRSHFYPKEGKFADYLLISPEIIVEEFSVLRDPVSDHLPLMLKFS